MSRTKLNRSAKTIRRELLAHHHTDNGGDPEHFIFLTDLFERADELENTSICGCGSSEVQPSRVSYLDVASFSEVTTRAIKIASERSDYVGKLLGLLADCFPTEQLREEQARGASYKRLAEIGHLVGMGVSERSRWYRVCESIPLSDRHASHILGYLKRRAS